MLLICPTAIFLALTFGIAWGLPALYVAFVPNVQDSLAGFAIVHFVSVFGPVAGGVAAAAWCGRVAMRQYFGFLTRIGIGWRWYAVTVGTIACVYTAVQLFNYAVGGPPLYGLWNGLILLSFVPLLGDLGAIEEPGFRGWLLPFMQRSLSPHKATFIVGVLWFLFHYKILLPGFPLANPRLPNWDYAAAFFLQIIALSYIFTVLFNATGGSVPLVFVAHWLINVAIKLPAFSGHWAVWSSAISVMAILIVGLGRHGLADKRKVTTG